MSNEMLLNAAKCQDILQKQIPDKIDDEDTRKAPMGVAQVFSLLALNTFVPEAATRRVL